jgi:hypothetical protein
VKRIPPLPIIVKGKGPGVRVKIIIQIRKHPPSPLQRGSEKNTTPSHYPLRGRGRGLGLKYYCI